MFKTAAVILVSDLFLQGTDENVLKKVLTELNCSKYAVKKVAVLHEHEGIISTELNTVSKQFDVVIVIGKLRNNAVCEALAKVTFQSLTKSEKFKTILDKLEESDHYELPLASKLLTGNEVVYPIIQLHTIFVLKEKYLDAQLNILRKRLAQYRLQIKYSKVILIQKNGNTNQLLSKIKNILTVKISQKNDSQISVTLESTSFDDIVDIERLIQTEFKHAFINSYIINNVLENVYISPDDRIQQAIEIIEKCLKDYGPDKIFLSFNGGKDCTVLLHLIYTVLSLKYPNWKNPIVCLYVRSENAFPEQDEFISQCQIYYNLEVISMTQSIKEALNRFGLMKQNLKACFMGTRRTDPFSNDLKPFQMTDRDWPQVMRVSPLLDWHYSDIWDYLLYYKVPYCKLYDAGYTSLGNATNTIKNPSLLYNDIYVGEEVYLPAYKMFNESKERSGRGRNNV